MVVKLRDANVAERAMLRPSRLHQVASLTHLSSEDLLVPLVKLAKIFHILLRDDAGVGEASFPPSPDAEEEDDKAQIFVDRAEALVCHHWVPKRHEDEVAPHNDEEVEDLHQGIGLVTEVVPCSIQCCRTPGPTTFQQDRFEGSGKVDADNSVAFVEEGRPIGLAPDEDSDSKASCHHVTCGQKVEVHCFGRFPPTARRSESKCCW
mmetsp:Transcript_98218/g.204852  ORF Transcript_98218/g.204852 Transcript_98218/m.204852 type:complete len:206 (-) Transcript_98218:147-764(-)